MAKNTKIYTPANYDELAVGDKIKDLFLGVRWQVISRTQDKATLKTLKGGKDGCYISISPTTSKMVFETIEEAS